MYIVYANDGTECVRSETAAEVIDMERIMDSGQVFRIYRIEKDTYSAAAGDRYTEIRQMGEKLFFSCSRKEFMEFWYRYFDLGSNYGKMLDSVDSSDMFLAQAAAYGRGIHILKQDLWEMMITFIISQQKQIAGIRKCVEALCRKYGSYHERDGKSWYGFPTAESIAAGGREELAEIGLGYRDRYVYETAVKYLNEKNERFGNENTGMERCLMSQPYSEAKAYLLGYCGIGEKVANCICLFGLGFIDAFPIDVHIKDILYREYYKGQLSREKLSDREFAVIVEQRFGRYRGYRGVVQQWIFAYELAHKN